MNFQNPYFNPYVIGNYPPPTPAQPSQQVTRVNGENGARSYQMGPNSSALLLDETGLIVWLCTTDGAGYKSVSAYDIVPHQEAPLPDYGGLETRITKLEEIINGDTANSATTRRKFGLKSNDRED